MRISDAITTIFIRAGILVAVLFAALPAGAESTFTNEDWRAMEELDSLVYAEATDAAGNLYIGGAFTMVGTVEAHGIAKWDGYVWSALGSGVDWSVWSIAVSGTDVYVGGDFSTAGGVAANRIARWDGSAWSALGSGVGDPDDPNSWDYVPAIAVIGTGVYAAGEFYIAGGVPVNNIAKWNGHSWSALGAGLRGASGQSIGHVQALAVIGSNLYAGGEFTEAGGKPANYIARWNGTIWSTVGSGMNDHVHALTVIGTQLYAGGRFQWAGGPANRIARWNGTAWSALGSGVDEQVDALAVSGTDIYAGGRFMRAGGNPAHFVAKWNGSAWSALGYGTDDYVAALAVGGTNVDGGTNLYVGGSFVTAGQTGVQFLARANLCPRLPGSLAPGRFTNLMYSPATGFSCTFLDATPGRSYRIQSSPSMAAGPWADFRTLLYTGPTFINDASATGSSSKFYRAVAP